MNHTADVLIVGGGPAGSTAARTLAQAGIDTVLLDRARFPRYKSCAGGIPVRTTRLLDFPIDCVVEDRVTAISLSYLGGNMLTRWCAAPVAYMVMRDRFDALLLEQAQRAGAAIHESTAVRAISRDGDGWQVRSDCGVWRCRYVLGADGANSVVARSSGLGADLAVSVALEAEVAAGLGEVARWRGRMNLDMGYLPWGYCWVFPKERLLSIGAVLPPSQGPRIRAILRGYLERLGLGGAPVEMVMGHKLLFRRGNEPIAGPGVALLGDAAGLADEFSEEGISYAVHSGLLAGRAVAAAIATGSPSLVTYQQAVNRHIMPELRAARLLARWFYAGVRRAPGGLFAMGRRLDLIWRALFRVLRGESDYDRELRRFPLLSLAGRTLLHGSEP